ncbi:hypothetical protein EYV94_23995 [Puteibacter caeruleilacunae]|nr:hypothetical protein EYV94_23995 [Puteibacter caeruleilacunae]
MSKKVQVKICFGTHCYVMGGSHLEMLEESLPAELKDYVEVSGSPCFGHCEEKTAGTPPFVEVNGTIIEKANIELIINYIREVLADGIRE